MHQGSARSPLFFVIVMEAISREIRVALPWELLYPDDLVVIAETEDDLTKRLNEWKDNAENRGMKVNMNKTKVTISGELVEVLADRKVEVACIQETRWKGSGCRLFGARGKRYKLFWMGGKEKTDGVGIFVAEKWLVLKGAVKG